MVSRQVYRLRAVQRATVREARKARHQQGPDFGQQESHLLVNVCDWHAKVVSLATADHID